MVWQDFLNIVEYFHGGIVWGRNLHAIKESGNGLDNGIFVSYWEIGGISVSL